MPDIFLSYSREDQAIARRVADGLQSEGFRVWWDQSLDAGAAYDEVTENALEQAKAVIVLWSRSSVSSRWVRAEATTADRLGTLVPVMIEACKRPIMFELRQSADLSGWSGDITDPRWRALVDGLRRSTGRNAAAPEAATRPEPKSGGLATAASPADRSRLTWGITAMAIFLLAVIGLWKFRPGDQEPERATPATPDTLVTLAVLPFANLSSDPEQEYFSDGLTEELLNQLAGVKGLRVAGRTSSFAFKGKNEDLREIAAKLGVNNLLEGSVRRDGTTLRITAQLIDGRDGAHRWSRTYDREQGSIFALQDEIARDVAGALSVTLDLGPLKRAEGGTTNVEAYDRLLRWRQMNLEERRGIEAAQRRVRLMREAVEVDPGFVVGWNNLSTSLQELSRYEKGAQAEQTFAESQQAWDRVVTLAPDSALLQARSSKDLTSQERWADAEIAARKYLDSGPLTYERAQPLGDVLFSMGRINEVIALQVRVIEIEPQAMFLSRDQQWNLYAARKFEEAEAEFRRSETLEGDHASPRGLAALRRMARGDISSDVLRDRYGPPSNDSPQWLRELMNVGGDRRAMLAVLRKAHDSGQLFDFQVADALGDKELALDAFHEALKRRRGKDSSFYWQIWLMPNSGVRADVRFKKLVRDLGLAEYWRSSGKWADSCRPVGEADFECQ